MKYAKLYGAVTLVCLAMVFTIGLLWAENKEDKIDKAKAWIEKQKPDGLHIPYDATGKEFVLKDNPYFPNLKIHSSEEIHIIIEAIPNALGFQIIPITSTKATEAVITIKNLEGFSLEDGKSKLKLFRHQDGYFKEAFEVDKTDAYKYTQDISKPCHVYFMLKHGTVYIGDEANSNPPQTTPPLPYTYITDTDTYVITQTITEDVVIVASNITLTADAGVAISSSGYTYGLYMSGKSGVTIKDCTINSFSYGIGIYSYSSGCTITNTTIQGQSYTGMWISYSSAINVITNTIHNIVDSYGMVIASYSNGCTIQGNTVYDTGDNIQTSSYAYNNTYTDNILYDAPLGFGVSYWSTGNYFYDNTVTDCTYYGIYFGEGSDNNTARGNTLTGNSYGMWLNNTSGHNIYHNNIYLNTTYNIYSTYSHELSYNSEGNWWGYYAAPGFTEGTDSNAVGVVDSYPYYIQTGWDKGYDPGEGDETPPTGTITINSGAEVTSSTAVTLTLSATDTDTGVSEMRFSNDNSTWDDWIDYATSATWTLTSGEDSKTVYVQFENLAGVSSTSYSDTILLDTTAPVISAISPTDEAFLIYSLPTITATYYDNSALPGWSYRMPVTITNSGSILTYYQFKIDLDYEENMQSDFDDLRFQNSSGTNLPYWLESKEDSVSATVWVKVNEITASGDTIIYMYYGNSTASSASSGDDTFLLFDDFTGDDLDTDKWTEEGTNTVSGGTVETSGASNANEIHSISKWDYSIAVKHRSKSKGQWARMGLVEDLHAATDSVQQIAMQDGGGSGAYGWYTDFYLSGMSQTWEMSSDTNFHTYQINWIPGSMAKYTRDSTTRSEPTQIPDGTKELDIYFGDNQTTDWVHVRKYTSSEPTVAFGNEQQISPSGINTNSVLFVLDSINVSVSSTITSQTITYTPSSALAEGSHTVGLQVWDVAGNSVTNTWSFYVDTIAPNTVSLSTPSDGQYKYDTTPAFDWGAASDSGSGVVDYQLQVDTSASFDSQSGQPLVSIAGITSTSYTITTTLSNGVHYWRVRARDIAGNYGSFGQTKLLLHMNGVEGAHVFTDSSASAHSVTVNSGAYTDTNPKKFGTASAYIHSDPACLDLSVAASDDWDFGSGDFTIDFWAYFNSEGWDVGLVSRDDYDASNYGFAIHRTAANKLRARACGIGQAVYDSTTTIGMGSSWRHIAFVRSGNTVKLFIDGNQEFSTSVSGSIAKSGSPGLAIGSYYDGANRKYLDGNIDELRIIKGIAKWTSNFTVPSGEHAPSNTFTITNTTPSLTSLSASQGKSGDVITITGTSFWPQQWAGSYVSICGAEAASITSWSDTQIVATVPVTDAGAGYVYVFTDYQPSGGMPFEVGWNAISGGDHAGSAYTVSGNQTIGGIHTNIVTFTVEAGATLTVNNELRVYADIATISGTVDAIGQGYGPGEGPGAPSTYHGGTGASHAARGGWGVEGASPKDPYGNRYAPDTMGSGGGSGGGGSSQGGAGGGLVQFRVTGTFINNGIINVSGSGGNGGVSESYGGGGGAGGSVLIVAKTVEGSGNIYAYGGNGGNTSTGDECYPGGGGSGGYVAINCDEIDYNFSNIHLNGGLSGGFSEEGEAENGQDGKIGFTYKGVGQCCACNCSCCGDGNADGKCDCPCNGIQAGSSANASSGNLNLDLDITHIAPVNSLPCNITLYYNSAAADTAGSLGPKWTHTFNHSITTPTGATNILVWRDGTGKAITFNDDDGDNVFESAYAYGVFAVITSTPGTGYTIRTKERLFYNFNLTGTLTSIQDMYANAVTCTYSSGLLSNVELSGGRKIYITSTGTSITSIADPAGNVTTLSYTGSGQLEYVKKGPSDEWKKRFTYNAGTNLIATKVDDPDSINNTTSYGYDFAGRLTTITKYIEDANKTLTITRDLYTGEATVDGFDSKESTVGFDMILNKATQKTDELGNSIDYSFDITGNMTSQTNARGYTTLFEYDERGNIVSSTNAAGANTQYTYGDSANPDLPTLITDALGYKTYIGYNSYGKVLSTTNAAGVNIQYDYYSSGAENGKLHTETVYGAGTAGGDIETHYTYDSYGYPDIKTIDPGANPHLNIQYDTGYNANGWLTSSKNPLNRETTYTYDYRGNNTDITYPDTAATVTHKEYDKMDRMTDIYHDYGDSDQTQTKYTYNKQGWLTKTEVGYGVLNITTNFSYDYDGNLTQTTVPVAGDQTDYTYYDNGWLHTTTRKLNATQNAVTENFYNANGNLARVIDPRGNSQYFTYNEVDQMTASGMDIDAAINASGSITKSYTYTLLGQVETITDYEGNVTTMAYDEVGRLKYKRTPQDNITVAFAYDKLGRTIRLIGPWKDSTTTDGIPNDADSANIAMTDFDNAGRAISTSVNAHTAIEYDYDDAGNMTQKTDGVGLVTTFTYDNMDRLTETAVNPAGLNIKSKNVYDHLGRVTEFIRAYLDSVETSTFYEYDDAGRVTKEYLETTTYDTDYAYNARGQTLTVTDANGKTTTYEYDAGGRLIKETNAKGDYTEYGYDLSSNRTSIKYRDSDQVETTYTFYKNNLLKDTVYPGYGDVSNTTHNLCDKNGNLIEQIDAKGNTTTFTYDDNNRLTGKTYEDDSTVAYTLDSRSNVLNVTDANTDTDNEYDDLNRLIAVTDTILSKSIVYGYNEDGTRSYMDGPDSSDTIGYTYDNAKRLSTVTRNGSTIATYTYNDLGLRTKLTDGNNSYTDYTYDATTRWLTLVDNRTSTAALISSFSYAYTGDYVGNKKSMTINGGDVVAYTYDDIYQLTNESRTGTISYTNAFVYDEVGNRTQLDQNSGTTVTNYTYNDANQLTQEAIVGGSTITYTFDANGNQITKTNGSSVYWSVYDYENHIVSYYDAISTNNYTQTFDAYGRMIFMDTSTTDRKRFYDGMNCIADYDTSNNPVAQYVTPFLDDNLVMSRSSGTYYYFHDGLGSVRNIYTSGQIWNNTYDYTAFGEPLNWTENVSIHNRFTFTGREWNSRSETYDYRSRTYNPYNGRFNRRDTIGYEGGINLYSYVRNNAVNYTDPYGLDRDASGKWVPDKKDLLRTDTIVDEWGNVHIYPGIWDAGACNNCIQNMLKQLGSQLGADDWEMREAATEELARLLAEHPEYFNDIKVLSHDQDPEVRMRMRLVYTKLLTSFTIDIGYNNLQFMGMGDNAADLVGLVFDAQRGDRNIKKIDEELKDPANQKDKEGWEKYKKMNQEYLNKQKNDIEEIILRDFGSNFDRFERAITDAIDEKKKAQK
jgi:RHS repeat-associated protein